jgi:mRNA interferase RelE/StbE
LAWRIEISEAAVRDLKSFDPLIRKRIDKFLNTRIPLFGDPRSLGTALQGSMSGFWRYRVGDYRILCRLVDESQTIYVRRIAHRSQVYR